MVIEPRAGDNDTRLRILYLYQMLLTQTNEDHTLSIKQITDRMMEQHNIFVHRTTVPKDIDLPRAASFEIIESVNAPGNTIWQIASFLCRS